MTLAASRHYVPVLRWKRGERAALHELGAERPLVIPLIEPVAAAAYDRAWAEEFLDQVATDWGLSPFFIDLLDPGEDPSPSSQRS